MSRSFNALASLLVLAFSVSSGCAERASGNMSFFVTSVPAGDGGNLRGLAGADAHCQELAEAVGSRNRQWRAYLSATAEDGTLAVNARDRIGNGHWFNAKGVQIAKSVKDLHGLENNLGETTALTEQGKQVGYWHDMLTGSNADGTAPSGDVTCRNWTSTNGRAIVGHSNKSGSCCGERETSWNSAHPVDGCTRGAFEQMGGRALYYCFAKN
jgi:hypothetical protein